MGQHYNLPHDHGQNTPSVLERMPEEAQFQRISSIFQLLEDGSRLRILWLLCHCSECVSNIAASVGMSSAAASHHLQILRKGGLITSRRSGKEVYYTLADSKEAELLHAVIDQLFEIVCPLDEPGAR